MGNHVNADLDDMVFEHRERNYGSYFLRKRYPKNLTAAVGLVAFFALLGGFGPLIAKNMGWIKEKAEQQQRIVNIIFDDFLPPPGLDHVKELPPPPPPPPPKPIVIELHEFLIPEPVPEKEADPENQTIEKIEELIGENLGLFNQKGADVDPIFDPTVGDEGPEVLFHAEPDPTTFISVDEIPNPVNLKDIQELVGYPTIAQQSGIEGKVLLRILVDKHGRYQKHIVSNSSHPILTKAVEKHISKLMFTPAIQGNQPIKFWVNIPFHFILMK